MSTPHTIGEHDSAVLGQAGLMYHLLRDHGLAAEEELAGRFLLELSAEERRDLHAIRHEAEAEAAVEAAAKPDDKIVIFPGFGSRKNPDPPDAA